MCVLFSLNYRTQYADLHLCRRIKHLPDGSPGYDAKQSDGEVPAQEFWGMWSTPSLALLPETLCIGVVATDKFLLLDQMDLFDILIACKNN